MNISYCTKVNALRELIVRNRNMFECNDAENNYVSMLKILEDFDASKEPDDDWKRAYIKEIDEDGYVPFNADRRLGQNQYASRHLSGVPGYEDLRYDYNGDLLRFKNLDRGNYHNIRVYVDDLEMLHLNYEELKNGGKLFDKFEEKD